MSQNVKDAGVVVAGMPIETATPAFGEQACNVFRVVDKSQPKINEVAKKFLADLDKERKRLPADEFPLCQLLIDDAFERVLANGRIPGRQYYADVFKQKPIKLAQKVFVPVKQYPKFNFAGKILGPKGNSLRRLQEETQCKIAVKGRTSMRDRCREEELRDSGDPRYKHLHKDLFLEISTVATPAESYARIAYALAEIRKYLIPDKNDEVSHEQLRELLVLQPEQVKHMRANQSDVYRAFIDKQVAQKHTSLMKRTSFNPLDAQHEMIGNGQHYEYNTRLIKALPLMPSAAEPLPGAQKVVAQVPRVAQVPFVPPPAAVVAIQPNGVVSVATPRIRGIRGVPPGQVATVRSPRFIQTANGLRSWSAH